MKTLTSNFQAISPFYLHITANYDMILCMYGDVMKTDRQLKDLWCQFFEKHGFKRIPGYSIIPENDPTVLFTTAGMHPLVPYLLGEPHPAGNRIFDVQRCIRTNDIDEVGDNSHLTCFEIGRAHV